jgi:hypothetical protein
MATDCEDDATLSPEQEREWNRILLIRDLLDYKAFLPLIELPGGLKGKFEDILACRYDDLRQDLSDFLDVLITDRWGRDLERDAASTEQEK